MAININIKTGQETEQPDLKIEDNSLIHNKLNKLKSWFNNDYRKFNEMLTRRQSMGLSKPIIDDFRNKTYISLNDLYVEAEKVVSEINRLEAENNGL